MSQPRKNTTWMFTAGQVRSMIPDGEAVDSHTLGTRLRRAGARFMWGWPVAEIEQVLKRAAVTPVVIGEQPLEVYALEDVMPLTAALGWAQTATACRWHLQGTRAKARRGYTPTDAVLDAMNRPTGKDWRKGMTNAATDPPAQE